MHPGLGHPPFGTPHFPSGLDLAGFDEPGGSHLQQGVPHETRVSAPSGGDLMISGRTLEVVSTSRGTSRRAAQAYRESHSHRLVIVGLSLLGTSQVPPGLSVDGVDEPDKTHLQHVLP